MNYMVLSMDKFIQMAKNKGMKRSWSFKEYMNLQESLMGLYGKQNITFEKVSKMDGKYDCQQFSVSTGEEGISLYPGDHAVITHDGMIIIGSEMRNHFLRVDQKMI